VSSIPLEESIHGYVSSAGEPFFVGLCTEGSEEPVCRADVRKDADHLLSPTYLLDEALQHVGSPKPVLILAWDGQHCSGVEDAARKHLKRGWGNLLDLRGDFIESSLHVPLRGGLQKLVRYLVHSVAIARRRLVNHVPTEVRLAPLPDEAGEGFPKHLDDAFVSVAGSDLNAGEAPTLNITVVDRTAPWRRTFRCIVSSRRNG